MQCNNCQRSFTSDARLKQHKESGDCATECPQCHKIFCRPQRLKSHLEKGVCLKAKGEKIISCGFCKQQFSCKKRLEKHKEKCEDHYCGDIEWHESRCGEDYDFKDLECYDCGDLLCRCPCREKNIKRLILEKKAIDERFSPKGNEDDSAYFDEVEGVPWENVDHWSSPDVGGCEALRNSEEHIWRCLYPIKHRQPREKKIIVEDGDYDPAAFNICQGCGKKFSSWKRLQYHEDHMVCVEPGFVDKIYIESSDEETPVFKPV